MLEGQFRSRHIEITDHAEEIAFYRGADFERGSVNSVFDQLVSYTRRYYRKKFYMGIVDYLFVKYGAVMTGYSVLGLPFIFGRDLTTSKNTGEVRDRASIMKAFVKNSSLLISLSKAVSKIIISYKDIQNISGYTNTIANFNKVVKDMHKSRFNKYSLMSYAKVRDCMT